MMTELEINVLVCTVMAVTILGAVNGVLIRWKNAKTPDEEQMWSKWWHRGMLAIRAFIVLMMWVVLYDYTITGIVLFATAIEYNITINLINKLKWYYVGTTAATDKLIRKLLPFVKWEK
jgi:hypothetical protein